MKHVMILLLFGLVIIVGLAALAGCSSTGDPRSDYVLDKVHAEWKHQCPHVPRDKGLSKLLKQTYDHYWNESLTISRDTSLTYRRFEDYMPDSIRNDQRKGPLGFAVNLTLEDLKSFDVVKGEYMPCEVKAYYSMAGVYTYADGDTTVVYGYGWKL